ncbi:MAG: homogentisate 1,2-dioxygenase [Alphaproteobacteria bacterium]|nr:homogentisate 1,2-dioxygenase [Alphaproteobacteria bacterium]
MKNYIPFPVRAGKTSRQAHTNLPEGSYEREIGKDGFFGPASHMYHKHPPTGWVDWQGPLRPRAFDLNKLPNLSTCPWQIPDVLYNAHTRIRFWRLSQKMDHLVRNGDGDELLFVHQGTAELYCDFGHLSIRAGDYIMVPRSTMWRLEPTKGELQLLLIEATNSSYQLPDKGLLGPHAIFDPAMLDVPALDEAFLAQQNEKKWQVRIKRRQAISTVTYPFNPLDAVGWKGDLAPVRINVADIRPLLSHRYHLPPSAHTTFVANRFVVCTFAPRPFETDADAIKIPFFHNNDDYDEVLFYHAGDFFSRDNIKAGMMTFHPCGFTHGPHPKALQNMMVQKKPATDEYAVMIDTRDALELGTLPDGIENMAYVDSWKKT